MRNKRRCGTTALWIGLMLLFMVLSVILFAEVDSDMPMSIEARQTEEYDGNSN